MCAATIGAKSLGDVSSETSTKSAGLFEMPVPFSNSDAALIMDLMGTIRTVTINGKFTGSNAQLRTFVGDIDDLQNGEQAALTFVSSWKDYSGKTFLIREFIDEKVEADENKVGYTLTLIEGSVLS